jgi:hypothetical protein
LRRRPAEACRSDDHLVDDDNHHDPSSGDDVDDIDDHDDREKALSAGHFSEE